jgi:hypothetical protein
VGAAAVLLGLLLLLKKRKKNPVEIPDDDGEVALTMDDDEVPIYASEYGLSEPSAPGSDGEREDPVPEIKEEMEAQAKYMSEYGLSEGSGDRNGGDEADPQAPREADELEKDEIYKSESNPEFDQDFHSDE